MNWLWKVLRGEQPASPADASAELEPVVPAQDRKPTPFPRTFHYAILKNNLSQAQWNEARRRVIDHVIRIVATSPWVDNLVLRGSLLLESWFPGVARPAGDIDWVVAPNSITMDDSWAQAFFDQFPEMLTRQPVDGGVEIVADEITTDDIWTYDRAPGRRIAVPWRQPLLPPDVVQLDFVFGELLFTGPIRTNIAMTDGGSVSVWTATKEESLAWKLIWLENDIHPQGKDLYDAVLLAENCKLPFELLTSVRGPDEVPLKELDVTLRRDAWKQFKAEYPNISGMEAEWTARLHKALEPTFS